MPRDNVMDARAGVWNRQERGAGVGQWGEFGQWPGKTLLPPLAQADHQRLHLPGRQPPPLGKPRKTLLLLGCQARQTRLDICGRMSAQKNGR